MLATLRAASADSLHALHFTRAPLAVTRRQAYRTLASLEAAGYLARRALGARRVIYRLTARAFEAHESLRRRASDVARRDPPAALAHYLWLRAALWAALAREGYRVGRGVDAQLALRRFLLGRQAKAVAAATGEARARAERVLAHLRGDPELTPLFRSVCPRCGITGPLMEALDRCSSCRGALEQQPARERYRCTRCRLVSDGPIAHRRARRGGAACDGLMRLADPLRFDLAWRRGAAGEDVVVLVIDDPTVALNEQLRALPLHTLGQPKVPVILRTTDPLSTYNQWEARWEVLGARHQQLLRAFSAEGDARLFPYATTAQVIDVRPDLQIRLIATKKEIT
ncbi:MAG: hypothetical protein HYS27_03135 [Deltaproteobacteria bacterium]|nr:hypothetical protein [Deltaproteobacteria bacterium]